MKSQMTRVAAFLILTTLLPICSWSDEPAPITFGDTTFRTLDVFELEYASDPQISPDGKWIVYVRNWFDIMKDRRRSNLWMIDAKGQSHQPLTTGPRNDSSPRWSPIGDRLAYSSSSDGSAQLYVRWMENAATAKITNLNSSPDSLSWSPDGRSIALTMHVRENVEPFVKMPDKPEGAEWAEPAKVIRKLIYRADGQGYVKEGFSHLFVVPADGGSPRQLTNGSYDHEGPIAWSPDGSTILITSNRTADYEYDPINSEIYEVSLTDRSVKSLTNRKGPDSNPVISPDGKRVAYLGFDDRQQGYQVTRLFLMNRDGTGSRCLTDNLDRDAAGLIWRRDGLGLFCQFDDQGNTRIAFISLDGKQTPIAEDLGGTTVGRPYAGGSFSVSHDGTVAYSHGVADRPADVAIAAKGKSAAVLTSLNADLLSHKSLGKVEEIRFDSSADGRSIQAWIIKPPKFDPSQKYPLLLEIHGGPFANYGRRFSAEMQLYAAAGYVVLYVNPRGSTGYGEEFGNLIHHNYPGEDYDDLMSGVDAVIQQGFVDERNLFVTGGSGGGILTAWIVGKTDRFRAAVSAKPVINWYSFVLTSDYYPFFNKYWFPGFPWEHAEHYLKRSPLSLVGNVKTPTMLLTGEQDYRTPISESEQFYQALKLRKIDSALVRIPGASHDISARPSNMISQVLHTLAWFEKYRHESVADRK